MRVIKDNNNTYITGLKDFDLGQTLECGQCFHFNKIADGEYGLVHGGRLLHAKGQGDELCLYDTDEAAARNVWWRYLDLDRDYGAIKEELLRQDKKLEEAINTMWGVRILNQDFFETMISFIISQNKQIPHIKQIVATISERYGDKLGEIAGVEYYSFPTAEQMRSVTVDELRECKTGFRAPYIKDAVDYAVSGRLCEEELRAVGGEQARQKLMEVKGIGSKVANCISLFGLGYREAFPVDVWIKRIVEALYFDGQEKSVAQIEGFGVEKFGHLGGYAQQYLFYYGKSIKLGVRGEKK